jgi:hypothetical protein
MQQAAGFHTAYPLPRRIAYVLANVIIVRMATPLVLLVRVGRKRLAAAAAVNPFRFRLISGMALVAGGMYFIYYWGMGRLFDLGRWGYKLGWYS